jgi:hypothetical protein
MNFFPLPRHIWTINLIKIVSKAEKENKSASKQRILDKINKSNALCPHRIVLKWFPFAETSTETRIHISLQSNGMK